MIQIQTLFLYNREESIDEIGMIQELDQGMSQIFIGTWQPRSLPRTARLGVSSHHTGAVGNLLTRAPQVSLVHNVRLSLTLAKSPSGEIDVLFLLHF